MPTPRHYDIGSSGSYDYTTLAAAVTAIGADITVTDEIWTIYCHNDSTYGEACSASTTQDATRYLTITCATGNSFSDNASVRSNALRFDQANGVAFSINSNYGNAGSVQRYTRIIGLQIRNQGAGGGQFIEITCTAKNCLVDSRAYCWRGFSATFINCIGYAHDAFSGSLNAYQFGDGHANLACTLIGCLAVAASNAAPLSSSTTGFRDVANCTGTTLVSCAAFGFTAPTAGTFGTSSNNATDNASGLPGTSNQHSVTYNATTPFVQADNTGSLDFRSVTSTALAGNGLYDGTNAPNDISGTTRANPPYIGVWEVSGGGGPTTAVFASAGVGSSSITGRATASSVLASVGASTVTQVGRSTAAAVLASAGVGAEAMVGTGIKPAVLASAGIGANANVGVGAATAVFASSGVGSGSAVGAATAAAVLASAGVGATSIIGRATAGGVFSASGVAAGTIVGASTNAAVFASSGAGVALFGSGSGVLSSAVFASSGVASGSIVGVSTAASVLATSGAATMLEVGAATKASALASTGLGAMSGVGAATAAAILASSGVGSFTGVGAAVFGGALSSSGVGAATFTGAALGGSSGVFATTGVGSFAAVGSAIATAVFSASGVGSFSSVGTALKPGVLAATGLSGGAIVGGSINGGILSSVGIAIVTYAGSSMSRSVFSATGLASTSIIGLGIGGNQGGLQASGFGSFAAVGGVAMPAYTDTSVSYTRKHYDASIITQHRTVDY